MNSSKRSLPVRVFVATWVLLSLAAASGCTTKKVVEGAPSSSGSPGETERRESVPCEKGGKTLPVEAFDVNPAEASGTACNVANVLDDDGSFAALDWAGAEKHKIDGRDVTGCLAAEFGDGITLSSLSMKMRPVGAGCGHACTPGDDGCGTGWQISIFAGPSLTKLKFLQRLSLTTADFFEYSVVVFEELDAKFVTICREPTPAGGDDIAIDALSGICR